VDAKGTVEQRLRSLNARRSTTRSKSPEGHDRGTRTMGVQLVADGDRGAPGRSWPVAGSGHRRRGIQARRT
jgi:hypothetical protein